ncbi:hypothetical protein BJ165DRAFT_242523 [Panaeolus papilionaceus]|nr:hypothetical protein BJ165DRAFT_242523 [Panaeolus papilionaceus]
MVRLRCGWFTGAGIERQQALSFSVNTLPPYFVSFIHIHNQVFWSLFFGIYLLGMSEPSSLLRRLNLALRFRVVNDRRFVLLFIFFYSVANHITGNLSQLPYQPVLSMFIAVPPDTLSARVELPSPHCLCYLRRWMSQKLLYPLSRHNQQYFIGHEDESKGRYGFVERGMCGSGYCMVWVSVVSEIFYIFTHSVTLALASQYLYSQHHTSVELFLRTVWTSDSDYDGNLDDEMTPRVEAKGRVYRG